MTIVLLAAFLASSAPSAATPAARAGNYWFKTYSTAPFKEFWSAELSVTDFALSMPKVLTAIERAGGKLTQPLRNFASSSKDGFQQLSFALPRAGAKSLLKTLRRLGEMPDPVVRPASAPIPVDEVKAKIALLMKERSEHPEALAKVPATSAAAEEILEHLLMVDSVAGHAGAEVLFDLQVKRK